MADFVLQESPNLISRKIWVVEKSWNFYTVFPKNFLPNAWGLESTKVKTRTETKDKMAKNKALQIVFLAWQDLDVDCTTRMVCG